MAARLWIGFTSYVEHLRRLAVVVAVPLRMRIVTELYRREMSPKQFYEEFGGGSIPRVAQHFKRLVETGWLRYIRSEGPGGKRHGGVEHFYRATELPFCDRDTWAVLPYSIRVAFSWHTLVVLAQMLRQAVEAKKSKSQPVCDLTATRIVLDEQGWESVVDAVGKEFTDQYDEQEDAARRVQHSGEVLRRSISILMAFESPRDSGLRVGPPLAPGEKTPIELWVRVSKVIGDEVCLAIVNEANHRPISVPEFHAKFGNKFKVSYDGVGRRFRGLREIALLKQVSHKSGGKRRGGTEKYYRAAGPALMGREITPWANPSTPLKKSPAWKTFEQLTEWVKEAIVSGTLDRRPERCMAWSILSLDQEGRGKLAASQDRLLAFILEEERSAKARLKDSGEEAVLVTISVGTFEPTPESLREP